MQNAFTTSFKKLILLFIIICSTTVYAQLDTIHWMPPMHAGPGDKINDHYIYLTTLEINPFDVSIYNGAGVLLATESISRNNPKRYTIGNGENTTVMVPKASLMTVLSDKGLVMKASKPFFANFRGKEPSQAEIITAKGRAAKGDVFRASCPPMENNSSTTRSFIVGIMATENNTQVTINDYNPAVKFATAGASVSLPVINITLNAGQSYVLSGYTQDDIANNAGFTGALITSNKPIVMNSGLWLGSIAPGNGQDILVDQAVPVCRIGTEYIVVKGEGTDLMERPLVLAHYNNTQIYAGGTLVTTINSGEHHLIDFSYWSGTAHKSMYIQTSQPAYLYQPLGGTDRQQTPGMNFIPPIPCDADVFPTSVLISDVARIGNTNYQSVLIANTRAGSTFSINGVPQGAGQAITGLPGWVTYRIPNINGNLFVESTSSASIGILGYDDNAGYAGYFSGFDVLFDVLDITNSINTSENIFDMGEKCMGDAFSGTILMGVCNQNEPHYILSVSSVYGSVVTVNATFQNHFDSSFVVQPPHPYFTGTDTLTFILKAEQGCDTVTKNVYVLVTWPELPQPVFLNTPYTLCYGDTLVIKATGGVSYLWGTGATSDSLEISPTITMFYNVTITDALGCINSDSVEVVVNPLPTAFAGNDSAICTGNFTQLLANGGINYLWTPATGLSAINTANPTASPTVTTTYTVTVYNAQGCSSSDDVVITVNPLPSANAGSNQTICLGQSANFTASGGTSYLWSTGATTPNINVNPTVATTYTVTVTDVNGCFQTSDVEVLVNTLPFANAGQDDAICLGNQTQLNASGGNTYYWSPSSGLSAANVHNPLANPTSTTTYTLTVTDANGCSNTDMLIITVLPLPLADAGANQSICEGEQATLIASGGVDYVWNTGDNIQSITVTPASSITYSLTVTDANTCSATADVLVTVNSLPPADAGNNVFICSGSSSTLNASGGVSYQWSPASGLSNANIANPVASPTSPVTYTVTVTDANGCSATDLVSVGIYPSPLVSFTANVLSGCEPLLVQFTDNSSPNIQSWVWNFGNNNASTQQHPIHQFQNAGHYSVSLTVTTTDGCTENHTIPNMIQVFPSPIADFLFSPTNADISNPIIYFNDQSYLATLWYWDFGDIGSAHLNNSNQPNPSHVYSSDGVYTVSLTVETVNGCIDSTSKEVIIKPEFTFYIPNAFTPDGDGFNDFFQGYGTNFASYEMYIFNRWGKLIYETKDYHKPWDGKNKFTGERLMQDVYVYKIIVKDLNNKTYRYFGHITLLSSSGY